MISEIGLVVSSNVGYLRKVLPVLTLCFFPKSFLVGKRGNWAFEGSIGDFLEGMEPVCQSGCRTDIFPVDHSEG